MYLIHCANTTKLTLSITRRISPLESIKVTPNYSSPWQILLSEVPLMWKPASQLQCCARFTWAQRGLRLKAGSFITLHSGGAVLGEKIWKLETCDEHIVNMYSSWSQTGKYKQNKESQTFILWYWPVWVWCWQWEPLQFWGQVHLYWLTPSTQVPPFWQGLLAHSLTSVGVGEHDHCSQLVEKCVASSAVSNNFQSKPCDSL